MLTRIELDGSLDLSASGPEVLICTAGDAGALAMGEARFVEAGERYTLAGRATVFRVEDGTPSAAVVSDTAGVASAL